MKKYRNPVYLVLLSSLLMFSSCSSRKFLVSTVPDSSMILMGSTKSIYPYDEICGTAPLEKKVTFFGKKDRYYLIAMNHGYKPDTVYVTRDSSVSVTFHLNRTEIQPVDFVSLKDISGPVTYILLPVNAEIILHKGVGNLDKYEKSDKLTRQWSDSIDRALCSLPGRHLNYIPEDSLASEWPVLSGRMKNDLVPVKAKLLPYYEKPASVERETLESIAEDLKTNQFPEGNRVLLVYVWCKSTEPTAGRVIGNAALTVASGVVDGYNSAMYGTSSSVYNPEAFAVDYSTIWVAYVIDPENGTVRHIEQRVLPYALTSRKNKDDFVNMLAGLPDLLDEARIK